MTSQVLSSTGHSLCDRTFSSDQTRNLLGLTDNLTPEHSTAYGTDDMNRLRSATTRFSSPIKSWHYDLIGSRRYYGYVENRSSPAGEKAQLRQRHPSPRLTGIRRIEADQLAVTQMIGDYILMLRSNQAQVVRF
jgi:hypothetical protein